MGFYTILVTLATSTGENECNQTCAGIRMPGMAYEPANVFVRQH